MIRSVIICICCMAAPALADPSRTIPANVVHVIDGDTLDVRAFPFPGLAINVRIRVLGIDTPETYRPECEEERDTGRLATAYVRSHIGDTVWLVDVQDERDSFGRVLARVVTAEGVDIGRELLREGLATVWPEPEGHSWCE